MGKAQDGNLHTSKPSESPGNSLQNRQRASEGQIMARIVSLELKYGRSPMTDGERRVWLKEWVEDLGHLSDAEIAYGCARYRRNPANRFFPTPGQLLEACKNPFDSPPGKTYAKFEELPPPMDADRAEQVIRATYRKLQYFPGGAEKTPLALKEEILGRPPVPFVPMTPERKAELLEALERRMPRTKDEEPVS